jgi:hypothetical protein
MSMNKKLSKLSRIFNPFNWSIWIVIKDIQNYREWMKTIDKEKANPNSLWNKFKMNHNYFYTIYFPISLPPEDKALPDNIKRLRIVETLAPVHRYLDEDLQFAEYIIPEFNQFYDEETQPTLLYGIVYRFAFKRLSLGWVIKMILIYGGLIWLLCKYPILHWIIKFINL